MSIYLKLKYDKEFKKQFKKILGSLFLLIVLISLVYYLIIF